MLSIKNLKQLLIIAKDLKKQLALATFFGSLGHLTVIFFTYLLTTIFLKISNDEKISYLIIITIIFALLKGLFSYLEQLLNHYVAFKILHVLRLKVLNKFKKISLNNFLKNNSGDYMTIVNNDIEILEVFYAHTITPFLIYVIQVVAMTFVVGSYSIELSFITLILYLIMGIIVPMLTKNRGEKYGDNYRNKLQQITTNSNEETYAIFETIQYNKINETQKKLEEETEQLTNSSYKKNNFLINLTFVNTILYNLSIILFIIFANNYLENKKEIIILCAMYIVSFTPVLYMGNISSTLSQTMAAGSRFLKLLNISNEKLNKGNIVDFKELKIKNLSFSYNNIPIIKNFNLTAKKGEIIGISGKSGSGKSTLAKIIMKIIPIENNKITIDEVDINNIDTNFFRKNSSIIMQDTYLFNSTLEKNIAIFDKKIDKKKLENSLKSTNLQEFVESLKEKENSIISEKSSNISSGQKQRISTSRTLYNDSKLIILDEATANIDIFSEIELLKTLEKIKNDKIIFIISHNKSTLSICDKIINV